MEESSFTSWDEKLEDLPFPIPRDLHVSGLVTSNGLETADNVEQFFALREYRTAAALLTVALQQLYDRDSQLLASLLCRRAECLLHMHYLQYVMWDCKVAKTMLGGYDEHIAFLFLRSHELQGEIEEALGYAIIYKALDPKMNRDKDAVRRLKYKVMWLCGQENSNPHHVFRTIDILMSRGDLLLSSGSADLAVKIYTELVNLFPGLVVAHERRAQCHYVLGHLAQANQDCNKALNLSLRTSTPAFKTKIEVRSQLGKLDEAMELIEEWRRINPENTELNQIEIRIKEKMGEKRRSTAIRQSQSMLDLSVGQESRHLDEPQKQRVKRVTIRASKQVISKKTKKQLQREEYQREKQRQQIGQELEAKRKEKESKFKKDKTGVSKEEQHTAKEKTAEVVTAEQVRLTVSPSLPQGPTFPERSRKRKIRRKTQNLRAKREGLDDDSDGSSVCPDDLNGRRGMQFHQRMPTFSDTETVTLSDEPKSSPVQTSFTKVRPRPSDVSGPFRLCWHYQSKKYCLRGQRCRFAHSEGERIAWEKDRVKGFSKLSIGQERAQEKSASEYGSRFTEFRQSFMGQCRAPFRIPENGGLYKMCPEWKGTCKLGRLCTFPHGEEELTEWNKHLEKIKNEKTIKEKENMEQRQHDSKEKGKSSSPLMKDEDEVRPIPNYKLKDLVSSLPGVTVSCEPSDLNVSLQIPLNNEEEISYNWTVRVCYESSAHGHLQHVSLLLQYHGCYTLSRIRFNTVPTPYGRPMELKPPENESLSDEFHYAVKPYTQSLHGSFEVEVTVSFATLVFGSFAEVLVFDFGDESPSLAVKMNIEVGSQEFLQEFGEEKSKLALDWTLWDDGSHEIVKCEPKKPSVFNNDYLIDRYKLPKAEDIVPCPLLDKSQGLSPKNYMDVMHQLLYVEEFYIRKQIASFNAREINLHVAKLIVKKDEVLCAQEGWLYGSFHVSRPITLDDAQGRLLLRNLFSGFGSVLIARSQNDSVVYEAFVDSVEDSRVIIKLSERCCKELELSQNTFVTVDIQFHINRLPLCEMHDNVDRLGPEHLRILFPELSSVGSEIKIRNLSWILDANVNEVQRDIIKKIAAPAIDAPPLVVFGPFGTGKTYTLSQAIRRISVNQNNRVLICTHSNSAADIHVELLHNYLKDPNSITACKPLRIYTPLRKLSTVSDVVKEYCLIADKGTKAEAFRLPTRDDVLRHRVVISTLGMSRALFDMDLHRGYFSHILIDEAAQALETETIAPLTLAGNKTKVVFTGDHMQMSPDVFSPQAKKWGFQISLQERLFYDYKRRQSGSEIDANLIFLTENYRTNERLLQFSSGMFYGGGLSSGSEQPLHPKFGPLMFYTALGKEEIEENHASCRNLAEVNEVVKRVKEISDCWPKEWGTRDLKQIAVVSSYRYQVKTIRDGLRKIGLGAVDVETIENIQGKQFRALFVSTVRTFHMCKEIVDSKTDETENPYLYFLSDPKLLNTALTRAQSLIAVVGDPFSLRTIGNCQGLWEEFIKRCNDDRKLFGIVNNELERSISQSGLNVNAAEFVPKVATDTSQPPAFSDSAGSNSSIPVQKDEGNHKDRKRELSFNRAARLVDKDEFPDAAGSEESHTAEKSEHESASDSDDAGDEFSESDDHGNGDDFAEFENVPVDETVPPKCMDPIIQALKEKFEENITKRKLKDEARKVGLRDEAKPMKVHSDLDTSIEKTKESEENDQNTTRNKIVHADVKMKTKKGKTQIFLVNLNYKYSERTERLLRQPKVKDQECLQSEYLDRLLKNDPDLYRKCTLRVNYEGTRTLYGEVQDPESEDIFIEGNTRQTFDRDVVVVKLSEKHSMEVKDSSKVLKGQIMGIRHHAINLRERQFVCTISRNNPRVMYPINKSMTPIANLNDERCKEVPIYKRIQAESHKNTVRVDTLSLKDALSGKFLFVVQYLQWRREFPYPLGIVTKTVRKGNNLHGSFKLLNAEYNLSEDFPEEVTKEAERKKERWSGIVSSERNSRPFIQNAFTIDPPGSKALDDALTVEELSNGLYRVGVHIADVSFFVSAGSRIDVEAKRRGTSYFRGHGHGEVLMLPEVLSHDICSLLPSQERLAVSVYVVLDQEGCIQEGKELEFRRSIVKSQCRLTYAQAQKVILGNLDNCRHEDGELTTEIKQSINRLNFLAQKRRKFRLSEGSYFHFDHADREEDLEAHELVEEMMILANCVVARHLVERNAQLSPLRIQRLPKTRKLMEWRERFGGSAKLSLSLRRHLINPEDVECEETFVLPSSTLGRISEAHRKRDQRELNLLVCNDNMYPQLAVAHSSLKGLQRKAEDVIAAEVPADDRMHWSLNVREYTRFTSPIRRYLDILVHRLLFETAGKDEVDNIPNVLRRCSFLSDNSSKFEKDCGRVEVALSLSEASCEVKAIVEIIEGDYIRLQLLSDVNQFLSPKQRRIKISHLGPIEQPKIHESSACLELTWKLRIYDASPKNIKRAKKIGSEHQDRHLRNDRDRILNLLSLKLSNSSSGHQIPGSLWMAILDAIEEDAFDTLSLLLKDVHEIIADQKKMLAAFRQEEKDSITKELFEDIEEEIESYDDDDSDDDDDDDVDGDGTDKCYIDKEEKGKSPSNEEGGTAAARHFIETSLVLKVADNVNVQMSSNDFGGIISPEIQLFHLAPGIDICLEHRRLADRCFTITAADQASQPRYRSINRYVHVWRPVLYMEAATVAIRNDDTIILQNLKMKWAKDEGGNFFGEFQLNKDFCETRQINFFYGDYACAKVHCVTTLSGSLSKPEQLTEKGEFNKGVGNDAAAVHGRDVLFGKHHESERENVHAPRGNLKTSAVKSHWVGHCVFTDRSRVDDSTIKYTLKLFQSSMRVPKDLEERKSWICTVEIIKQTITSRRMISTLNELAKTILPVGPTPLAHKICKGTALRLPDRQIRLSDDRLSIVDHVNGTHLRRLNNFQVGAVRQSLRGQLTLIQGPPGTGKTITGVHIAYWFADINHREFCNGTNPTDTQREGPPKLLEPPKKAPPQVLYCGPSNKSVDVVAEYLIDIPGIQILRVYGHAIEEEAFPIPNRVQQTRKTALYEVPEKLKRVSLHHVIRNESSPFAEELKRCESNFVGKKKDKKKVDEEEVEEYLMWIAKAEKWAIRSVCQGYYYQVVLCTCSTAGSKRLRDSCNNTSQCIVDESAMCLEPETMIPIFWSQAKQVVLIGDHMQLQPIVTNRVASSLGLSVSMFQRYASHAMMLEEQYRMHEAICEFPSKHFYDNRLKTANSVNERERNMRDTRKFVEFWPSHAGRDYVPLAFCNVVGKEEELVVTTDEGNERSKSNIKEKDKVVEVINKLIDCGVKGDEIVVLSPYRAQCHLIEEDLKNKQIPGIQVMSIVKSQGSESDFVIISLVRSLPASQIDQEPSGGWLREKLGFVTDEHQINVALTRAKRGLCIIGNKNLLEVCEMWGCLIDHYRKKSCLVDGDHWPVP